MQEMKVLLVILVLTIFGIQNCFGQCYALPSPDNNEVRIFAQDVCGSVDSNPLNPTVFTIDQPRKITKIGTYHWNSGQGTQTPGTIGLQDQNGKIYGPWQASGQPGQGGVPNAYWIVTLTTGLDLTPGTYKVLDSDPSTWAYNSESDNSGVVSIVGLNAVDQYGTPSVDVASSQSPQSPTSYQSSKSVQSNVECTQSCKVCDTPPCLYCSGHLGDIAPAQSDLIYEMYSPGGTSMNPPAANTFTLDKARTITCIATYHWPGYTPGTIGLLSSLGDRIGPWQAEGRPGMDGRPNCVWVVYIDKVLEPGTYAIIDSGQSTWSYVPSDCTGSKGICQVYAAGLDVTSPLNSGENTPESIPLADLAKSKSALIAFPSESLSKVITPSEGGIVQDEGMSLTAPPGAVSVNTEVVVKRLTDEFPPGTLGDSAATVISKVYDFGPDGIKFKEPVQVTISYDPGLLPDGTDESNIMPAYFDGQKWITFKGSVDKDKKEVSFRAQEFSGSLITIVGAIVIPILAGYAIYTEVPRKVANTMWEPIIHGTANNYVTPRDDAVVDFASRARLTSNDGKDSIPLKDHTKIASWLEKSRTTPLGFADGSGNVETLQGRYSSSTEFMKTPNEYLTKYDRVGDCVDVTDALVSIFLANGYPAKAVSGYTKVRTKDGFEKGGPHAWGEVLIGDKVYCIDEDGQLELKEKFISANVVIYPEPSDPRYRMWDDKKTEPYDENWYKAYLKATPGGSSASGTFPDEPFNGMQIDYSVTGASIINSTDSPGFTTARTLQGTLGSGELRVSGAARMGSGYNADLTVRVWAGDKENNFSANIPSGYPGFNESKFDVAVPIPQGVNSGGFSIDMTGYYNAGDRGLIVSGDLSNGKSN